MGSDAKSQMIEGMISAEGEVIQFTKPIQIKNEIEVIIQDFKLIIIVVAISSLRIYDREFDEENEIREIRL